MADRPIWNVKVRRTVNDRWSYRLIIGSKIARRDNGFASQAEAAYAAGRATTIELDCQGLTLRPGLLPEIRCDWGS